MKLKTNVVISLNSFNVKCKIYYMPDDGLIISSKHVANVTLTLKE
jgi:hypothetical protein